MSATVVVPSVTQEQKLLIVLVSAVFHHIVYLGSGTLSSGLFKKYSYSYPDQRAWRSRCTSMVHAFIVGALGFYVLFIEKKLDMEVVWTATNLSTITMAISTGYFLWDSIVVLLRYDLFGFLFALHGLYCLYVYAAASFYLVYHYHAMALLMFEWSTPFMNAFFMADQIETKMDALARASSSNNAEQNNKKQSKVQGAPAWYKMFTFILSGVFALSFFLVRIVWGNYHYYHFYRVCWNLWYELPAWFNISLMALIIVAFLLNGTWMVQIILTGLNLLPKPDPNVATSKPGPSKQAQSTTPTSTSQTADDKKAKKD